MSRSRLLPVVLSSVVALGTLAGCTGGPEPAVSASAPAADLTAVPNLPQVVARVEPSVVTVLVGEGLGSGVVFRAGGLVLTNQHVVGDARQVQLALADGSRVPAQVVATDVVTDLAVLRAERTNLPPAQFRTELPQRARPCWRWEAHWAS